MAKNLTEEIKLRYSPEEMNILKEKAKLLKKNLRDYQIEISKNAKIEISKNG